MRKLIYVPILHTLADMGSIAPSLEARGIAIVGKEGWERHKKTISGFWSSLEDYFKSLEVKGFQIYQDGMCADGELGMKIVNEAAGKGSRNYQLVKKLTSKGAKIMKTEDIAIVKKEAELIKKIANSQSKLKKLAGVLQYKMIKKKLLEDRDRFIANTINKTLDKEGILFIGAYHDVIPRLEKDIEVEEAKEKAKIEEYQKIFFLKSKELRAKELSIYLRTTVKNQ